MRALISTLIRPKWDALSILRVQLNFLQGKLTAICAIFAQHRTTRANTLKQAFRRAHQFSETSDLRAGFHVSLFSHGETLNIRRR